jgi:hypothetical protein
MLFKNSIRTSKRTPHFTITEINWLTLFKEIIHFAPRVVQEAYIPNAQLLNVKAGLNAESPQGLSDSEQRQTDLAARPPKS